MSRVLNHVISTVSEVRYSALSVSRRTLTGFAAVRSVLHVCSLDDRSLTVQVVAFGARLSRDEQDPSCYMKHYSYWLRNEVTHLLGFPLLT
jgi:hypothetical protein